LKSKISIKFRVITGLGTPLALFQVKGEQEMWVAYKEIAEKPECDGVAKSRIGGQGKGTTSPEAPL